jgi:plastocyanin
MHLHRFLPSAVALGCLSSLSLAQQFQQVTAFPGAAVWSEGVECADVDKDGDLDVFFADGDGFSSAGTQRQSTLFINQLIGTGPAYTFTNESVARLGTNLSVGKGVITADIDGDGWVDALFANAFLTDPPFLYHNRGAAQPGFFDQEAAARGLTAAYSSGNAQFGDLDDDGDLDLILNDAYLGAAAGKPHLFFNDGAGVFTENAAALNAPNKSAQMDVQLVDLDNDWDLDFVGVCRAVNAGGNHYVMLNNGAGSFTDVSSLLTAGNGNTYENDLCDLDGDNDADMFFVSLSGFAEGAVRNNMVPNGSLSFTAQATFGTNDDNEVAFCDYDNDGDYDVFIGSLGASEAVYRNNGALSFTAVTGTAIQAQADSSLDCTFADLNNDGKYDFITAQGESGAFTNKFYRNTGTADTLAPVITAEQIPASLPTTGPWTIKAKIRDQVLDDGINYVRSSAEYVVLPVALADSVTIQAGSFSPAVLNISAGTTVTFSNASGGVESVTSATAPYVWSSGNLNNGSTYSRTFVAPGTYNYTSAGGGFSGQIVVTGTTTTVGGLHMAGQLYRFRMSDNSGAAGVQLCYELRFTDWPGNVRVSDARAIPLASNTPGTAFCFGNGSLATACPCGNTGGPANGCANSANASGSRLWALGSTTPDTIVFNAIGELPTALTIFLQGDAINASGAVFGDGVRCVAGALKRLYVKNAVGGAVSAPAAGDLSVSARSAALGDTIVPGTARHYQAYYRDANPGFCPNPPGNTWNVSNGWTLNW